MTPAQARKTIKNLARALSGANVAIPSTSELQEVIEVLQQRGASATSAHAATQPLGQSVVIIDQKLLSKLKELSKAATRAQLAVREAQIIASSIATATGVDVLPRRVSQETPINRLMLNR